MKLRFSNGKNLAIPFEANDIESFREQGASALRSFRIATERRVHRGETHETESWFEMPELHILDEITGIGQWVHPRDAEQGSFTIRFATQAKNLDDMNTQDAALFAQGAHIFWAGICNIHQHILNIHAFVMSFDDEIRRKTEDE